MFLQICNLNTDFTDNTDITDLTDLDLYSINIAV